MKQLRVQAWQKSITFLHTHHRAQLLTQPGSIGGQLEHSALPGSQGETMG